MATRKRTNKAAKGRKTAAKISAARRIYSEQKKDYQSIFRREIKKGGDSKKAAIRAGSVYRSRYGATKTARWKNALKNA